MLNSGSPVGIEEDDIRFLLLVLRDGSLLEEWEPGQYAKRKRAVRAVLVSSPRFRDIARRDDFASGIVSEEQPVDPLFRKKGWNSIDSGFSLWGARGEMEADEGQQPVDSFLASKGWNDIDSGFRLF